MYGDIAANYYIFVGAFAGYAYRSRLAVALHVALAAAACMLPLVYLDHVTSRVAARTLIQALVLVVIAGIVTVLREALHARQRELEALTLRDPLTGVGNYRLLSGRLAYEIGRQRRSGTPLTVMLLDLDGFKNVNDTFGHPVGDLVLCAVAEGSPNRRLSFATGTRPSNMTATAGLARQAARPARGRARRCVGADGDSAQRKPEPCRDCWCRDQSRLAGAAAARQH